jgi:glycosyltransferase domain-containing protein
MSIHNVKSNYLLGEITIIIFSRNRHQKLKKVLEYWGKIPVKVIVLHRTLVPLSISDVPNNINYIVSDLNYADRAKIALELIRTEFSIICSDDEVYLMSALFKMVKIMHQDINLKSIGGQCIAISNYGNKIAASKAYGELFRYSLVSNNARARLEMHLFQNLRKVPVGGMYRLMRSEDMSSLLKIFSKATSITSPYVFEVTGEIFTALIGNCTYLDEVYWIRNWDSEIVSTNDWDRNNNFSDWWFNYSNLSLRDKWIQSIAKESQTDIDIFQLTLILNHYLSNQKSDIRKDYKKRKYRSKNYFNVKYFLRKIIPFVKQVKVLESLLVELSKEGRVFSDEEVTKACEYVL